MLSRIFYLFIAFQCWQFISNISSSISSHSAINGVVCASVTSRTLITSAAGIEWSNAVASNEQTFIAAFTPNVAQTSGISKVTNGGSLSIIAGSVIAGVKDGTGTSAGLASPSSLIFDPRASKVNDLYFIDKKIGTKSDPHFIRKLDISTGRVTTVFGNGLECGTPISPDPSDGVALQAFICLLSSIVFDNNGNIYLLDDNIVRLFNVDAGTVTTIVGTYRGNPGKPGEYIDSDKGKNAYLETGVSRLFVDQQQSSDLLWVWSGAFIHRVNITNNDRPVRSYSFMRAAGFLSLGVSALCQSRSNPSILYGFSRCSTSSADNHRYSGQMVTYDLGSFNQIVMAGTGSDCAITDGNSPSFRRPSECSSLIVNAASEELLLIEDIINAGESTVIRSITIGDGSNVPTTTTTPSPYNPSTTNNPSTASSHFVVMESLIAIIGCITVSVVTFFRL